MNQGGDFEESKVMWRENPVTAVTIHHQCMSRVGKYDEDVRLTLYTEKRKEFAQFIEHSFSATLSP